MRIIVDGAVQDVAPGMLLEALRTAGFFVYTPCGGGGRCGKCLVRIENSNPPTPTERAYLDAAALAQGWRLACQTAVFAGMRVALAQGGAGAQIAVAGQGTGFAVDADIQALRLRMAAPTLADQADDLSRLSAAAGKPLWADSAVLRVLPDALRAAGWQADVILRGEELLAIGQSRALGVAVDIGTTTLAAYLLDLATGEQLAQAGELNAQAQYGGDVISRCEHAAAGALDALRTLVTGQISTLIARMCVQAGVAREQVFTIVCTGNTVMLHLLHGVTPAHIAAAPFTPVWTQARCERASALGITAHPLAYLHTMPCVAGYVGADTVAAMLSGGLFTGDAATLLIDIGTNGEIALAADGQLWACSTAAGPAFEGAQIRCGIGGVSGAINTVTLDGALRYTTIGNQAARGICGSGLIDLVAGLLNLGVIEDTGRIDADAAPGWLSFDAQGNIVVDAAQGIVLCKRDVREVQLAKGSIAAGIDVLLAQAGLRYEQIERVLLAGGFGSYMDKHNAARIGLIPLQLADKTAAIGNAAGEGAKAVLINRGARDLAERLARDTRYIELSGRADFQDAFMDKMLFA